VVVGRAARDQQVVVGAADQLIGPGAADKEVPSAAADQLVIAATAHQDVVPAAPLELVVAVAAEEDCRQVDASPHAYGVVTGLAVSDKLRDAGERPDGGAVHRHIDRTRVAAVRAELDAVVAERPAADQGGPLEFRRLDGDGLRNGGA